MKPPVFPLSRPSCERGMALVITLSIVVLLTFLVVAFFSSATANRAIENTSAGGVRARLLAEGALGAIEGEFIQEIVARSDAVPSGGATIYNPKTSADMVPQRALTGSFTANETSFLNLIKQSGRPFFTGGSPTVFSFATSDNTAAESAGKVNPVRWAAPMLTGTTFAAAQTPNWIYVTPSGYSATAGSGTIGRLAFNVYDVGGLLDANVAGFAPKSGGGDPDEMPFKGSSIWADLRSLPGISADAYLPNSSWPPQWRISGNWATFTSNATSSSFPFYQRTGWRQPYLDAGGNSSDRMFTSRQDLIRYAKANSQTASAPGGTFTGQNGAPLNPGDIIPALQYLTHWSRDRERPTFRPNADRPKVAQSHVAGGNDAQGKDDFINPALVSQTKADGTLAIKKRFPLSRLSLVSTPLPPAGPTANPADILKYFGLTWDATNNRWNYNHGSAASISRLSDVPADRDPDFFELLKAALTVGSLGKQFGFSFPDTYAVTNPSSRLGGDDGRIEDQIVQIAANAIDQSDPDSYPTRIRFNGRTFYGIEDLPRIYRAHEASYLVGWMPNFGMRTADAAPIKYPAYLYVTMLCPELWNPHRPSPSGAVPGNFRVVARSFSPVGGEAYFFWNETGDIALNGGSVFFSNFSARPGGPNCSALINYVGGEDSGAPNAAITFNLGTGDAGFREPRPLSAVGYPAGSNANGWPNNPDMPLTGLSSPSLPDTIVTIGESAVPPPLNGGNTMTYRNALGFVASYLPLVGAHIDSWPPEYYWLNVMQGRGGPVAFELQYQDPSLRWWTIDRFEIAYANGLRFIGFQSHVANRADPRTSRWGSLYSLPAGWSDTFPIDALYRNYRFNTGITANPGLGDFPVGLYYTTSQAPGWTGTTVVASLAKIGLLQANTPSSSVRYTDPDGVLRGADARYAADSSAAGWPMITGNNDSRPVMLNRPFRSVAEMGNVFRDTPWRNLDFMSPESGDRALLDVFTISEIPEDGIVAGRMNLNTRQTPVVAALIRGAGLATGAKITLNEATAAAAELTTWTTSTDANQGPLGDRSELVGRFVSGTTFQGPLEKMADKLVTANRPIKASREAVARALADAGTTRSWNLLVDVIAQSGQTSPSGTFVPMGESRMWTSVAIDRFSAETLEQFTETVQE